MEKWDSYPGPRQRCERYTKLRFLWYLLTLGSVSIGAEKQEEGEVIQKTTAAERLTDFVVHLIQITINKEEARRVTT